ncbi:MAG TPA: hypothetical protein VKW78_16150 [Terriglobales bacterium]|nr:hypothetical protein [Terriglobales bacterium]
MAENLTEILRRELNQLDTQMQEMTKRREAIISLLNTYSPGGDGGSKLLQMPKRERQSVPSSTLDMAQKVLEKRGEMKAEELMEAIREEYGVRPAHTLPQMLYIRARAKKRFYRSPEGKFGVVSENKRRHHGKRAA